MSSFILSWTVTMIGVEKGCDEMFMWKANHCFVFFIDTLHAICSAVSVGVGEWVILLLTV